MEGAAKSAHDHKVVYFLTYCFSAGFDVMALTSFYHNHTSARDHPTDMASYITTELAHSALPRPFEFPPFFPWCQTSPLLTLPKKDNTTCRVILDLSWPSIYMSYFGLPPTLLT